MKVKFVTILPILQRYSTDVKKSNYFDRKIRCINTQTISLNRSTKLLENTIRPGGVLMDVFSFIYFYFLLKNILTLIS